MTRRIRILLVVVVVVLFAWCVWTTRYHYEHTTAYADRCLVRIDRFTGETEILFGMRGWQLVAGSHDEFAS